MSVSSDASSLLSISEELSNTDEALDWPINMIVAQLAVNAASLNEKMDLLIAKLDEIKDAIDNIVCA